MILRNCVFAVLLLVVLCSGAVLANSAITEYTGFTVTPGDPTPIDDGDKTPVNKNVADKSSFEKTLIAYSELARGLSPKEAELLGLGIILLFGGATAFLLSGLEVEYKFNDKSRRIYEYVNEHPGADINQIGRALNIAYFSVRYNLDRLIRYRKVMMKKHGRKNMFYLFGPDNSIVKKGFVNQIVAMEKQHLIFQTILDKPAITQKELVSTTNISPTTLQWHVSRLQNINAITSVKNVNSIHYSVTDDFAEHYQDHIDRRSERG